MPRLNAFPADIPAPARPAAAPPLPEQPSPHQRLTRNRQISALEKIIQSLKGILAENSTALRADDIKEKIETLEEWLETYRRGLLAAEILKVKGTRWLERYRQELKLGADEQLRMADEGGPRPTASQREEVEIKNKLARELGDALPQIQPALPTPEPR